MTATVVQAALFLAATSFGGSALGFCVRRIPHRLNDIFLGFCAGMMLGAAIVCLALPALESVGEGGFWKLAAGVVAGAALISVLDKITPHLHNITGLDPEEHHPDSTINRVMLFVIAIALHKLPEGMAAGIACASPEAASAETLSLTLALQNIPEGLVVVTPLIVARIAPWRIVAVASSVALLEVGGVFLGAWLGSLSQSLLPALMAGAAGAMIYVISDEMIPETHSHGFQKAATFALILGFLTTLALE